MVFRELSGGTTLFKANADAIRDNSNKNVLYVDGTNGAATNSRLSWKSPLNTIQAAVTAAAANATVYVMPKEITAGSTDPSAYAETIIIPVTKPGLKLIGVDRGRTQGGVPEIKKGSGSTALITVRAPGCYIANLGINGGGSTGGGILLDDDGSTKTAFGTTITNCHFKNCKGSSATNAATGGAIMWSTNGSAWQVYIKGNRFYKNVGDIVLLGTSVSVPQDVVIEDNVFGGPAASVDCNLYLAGGSGMNGVIIRNNSFTCFPAIGSGTNATTIVATGCIGTLEGNTFACSSKTFGAAGNVLVPTTVLISRNYQEVAAGAGATGEIGRT